MFSRLLLLAWCCAFAFAQQGTSIEGRIVSSSGSPVRRASVVVRNPAGPVMTSGPNTYPAAVSTMETDAEGRFSVQNVGAGTVIVSATRAGYSEATQTVTVAAGQRLTDVTLRMPRLGVIYGKIVDEYDDPFARVNVGVFRRVYENGWRWQQQTSTTSGPDGTYAVGDLRPGRYYVAAMDMSYSASGSHYVQTFYPGATEPNGATAIDIGDDSELHGIDIRVQKGRTFRVSGKLTSPGTLLGASVSLVPADSRVPSLMRPSGGVNMKDNTFTIERAPEGAYYAIVQTQVRMTAENDAAHPPIMVTGRMPVTVSGRDVDNLTIALVPGVELTGRVRLDGTLTSPPSAVGNRIQQQPQIFLRSLDPAMGIGQMNTQAQPDGTFVIKNVAPGTYQLNGIGLPNSYLASARYDGQDVTSSPITIGSGAAGTIEAVFKTDGAKLTGVVRDEKGDPLTDVRVTLWSPSSKVLNAQNAVSDPTGAFRFQNVPPGEYRVAAWDRKATAGPVFSNVVMAPEFFSQFDTAAATVRLSPSGEQTQDVNVIPGPAMEAALARLP